MPEGGGGRPLALLLGEEGNVGGGGQPSYHADLTPSELVMKKAGVHGNGPPRQEEVEMLQVPGDVLELP